MYGVGWQRLNLPFCHKLQSMEGDLDETRAGMDAITGQELYPFRRSGVHFFFFACM